MINNMKTFLTKLPVGAAVGFTEVLRLKENDELPVVFAAELVAGVVAVLFANENMAVISN